MTSDGTAGINCGKKCPAGSEWNRKHSGYYPVVLAPQAVADIVNNVLLPSLRLDSFYAGNSTFQGKLAKKVTSEILSVYDNGCTKGLAASKGITCEGLPTGKTELITSGILSGLLSNDYETKRILNDEKGQEKLGVDPHTWQRAIVPRNGFRFGQGGGRNYDTIPSISPTNVIIEGENGIADWKNYSARLKTVYILDESGILIPLMELKQLISRQPSWEIHTL